MNGLFFLNILLTNELQRAIITPYLFKLMFIGGKRNDTKINEARSSYERT